MSDPPYDSAFPASGPEHWLLLGVCGAGVSNLCHLLRAHHVLVTGSDSDAVRLQHWAETHRTQAPGSALRPLATMNWQQLDDCELSRFSRIVHSVAIPDHLPLLARGRSAGCRIQSLPEALGDFCRGSTQVCVAGTHGKTTTSGMLWWLLQNSGLATGRYIGGEFQLSSQPAHAVRPARMVLESCEYRDSFLTLSPELAILTGIEQDHLDWFAAPGAAEGSFEQFLSRLPTSGVCVVNADCSAAVTVAARVNRRIVGVGQAGQQGADSAAGTWTYAALSDSGQPLSATGRLRQDVLLWHRSGEQVRVRLSVPGRHNAANAAMAVAAGVELGLSPSQAAAALADFPGMQRRLEHRGVWRGADFFDDYAHHPTAVEAVLSTLRSCFPGRRLLAVFEPHQCSRLRGLMSAFAGALSLADESYVLPALRVREMAAPEEALGLSRQLVRLIRNGHGQAKIAADLDHVAVTLDHVVRPGDIVVTLGAGRTDTIHDQINRRIQRDSAA